MNVFDMNMSDNAWSKSDKSRVRMWEERGYGVKLLSENLVDVYLPNAEDQHYTYITMPFCPDMNLYAAAVGRCAMEVWKNKSVPVDPWLMYSAMWPFDDVPLKKNLHLFTLMLLTHCDELWVIGSDPETFKGHVEMDIRMANSLGIPVRFVSFQMEDEDD